MEKIVVPPLGESITEATIAKIHKNIGDNVEIDEILFELETDKVTLEVNSTASGQISSLEIKVGDNVSINQELCTIDSTKSKPITPQQPVDKNLGGPKNSPAAEKIIDQNNLNKSNIKATGKSGRITKRDVLHSLEQTPTAPITDTVMISDNKVNRVKMSKLRQKIAQRLKDSQNTAAILTTFNEIDMHNVINVRAKYKEMFLKKYSIKLGFMSFFVKAVISSLKEVPEVNSEISGDHIIYKNYYDIGVAVGTEQGLVVPILRNADKLSIAEIELGISKLGAKAKDGKLTLEDMQGGTFTISNGGVYGSLFSTPIINPPQSGILGMHSIQKRPMVVNDKIEIRPIMYVALSYDHRIVDGKGAVTFLLKIKQYIEDPQRLLLEI